MRRKLFTFLVAFLATLSGAVWGQNSYSGSSADPITVTQSGELTFEDFTLTTSGHALTIGDGLNVTIVLKGTNEINNTSNGPTIILPTNSTLTIKSDGNQTGLTGNDILRVGHKGAIAIAEDDKSNPKMGSIVVESGLLYVYGNVGHDNSGQHGDITMKGGVAFVNGDIRGSDKIEAPTGGILFTPDDINNPGNGWTGILYPANSTGTITLTESFSGLDIDKNGTYDPLTLDLNGNTAQLGDGVVFDNQSGQLRIQEGSGTLIAFDVNYEGNYIEGCSFKGKVPVDNKWYGTNTTVTTYKYSDSEIPFDCANTIEEGQTGSVHQRIGWFIGDENGNTDAVTLMKDGGTFTTQNQYPNQSLNTLSIKAAWAEKERVITIQDGNEITPVDLISAPKNKINYSQLDFGSSGLSGLSITGTQITGTVSISNWGPDETRRTFTGITTQAQVNGNNWGKQTQITIYVEKEIIDITDADVEVDTDVNNYTYMGVPFEGNVHLKKDGKDLALTDGVHFIVTYTYYPYAADGSNRDTNNKKEGVTEVKDAGFYVVTKVAAKENNNVCEGSIETFDSEVVVTVKQRELTVQANNQRVAVKGSISAPSSSTLTLTGLVTINEKEETPAFGGSITSTQGTETIGVYSNDLSCAEVTLKDNEITGFYVKNYKRTNSSTNGTLTVYQTIPGDGEKDTEIKNTPEDVTPDNGN